LRGLNGKPALAPRSLLIRRPRFPISKAGGFAASETSLHGPTAKSESTTQASPLWNASEILTTWMQLFNPACFYRPTSRLSTIVDCIFTCPPYLNFLTLTAHMCFPMFSNANGNLGLILASTLLFNNGAVITNERRRLHRKFHLPGTMAQTLDDATATTIYLLHTQPATCSTSLVPRLLLELSAPFLRLVDFHPHPSHHSTPTRKYSSYCRSDR